MLHELSERAKTAEPGPGPALNCAIKRSTYQKDHIASRTQRDRQAALGQEKNSAGTGASALFFRRIQTSRPDDSQNKLPCLPLEILLNSSSEHGKNPLKSDEQRTVTQSRHFS